MLNFLAEIIMSENINPWQKSQPGPTADEQASQNTAPNSETILSQFFETIRRWGLSAAALRFAATSLTILLILVIVWFMDTFYLPQPDLAEDEMVQSAAAETVSGEALLRAAPQFHGGGSTANGVAPKANLHTILPIRQVRYDVIEYTVELGDTIFSIAEKFNLMPETILWGNRYTLGYDPHFILPGQELYILPVDGVYHRWSAGEGLNGVAEVYGVTPEVIINWEGNKLDPEKIGDYANPKIPENTMLVIPGGKGAYPDFSLPRIGRSEPSTALYLGPGACTGPVDGISGTLNFIWPTTERYLSGYDYTPETNHFGIDIGGVQGNPIYAADSGVVVYAGWNDYGYGEMIVIDHGYGWQTLYAHLSQINVSCGQEVFKGDTIGLMGNTGVSTGPHLHFEMRSDEFGRVNPWDFLN